MKRLTKSQYEAIAETIASECRSTLSVYHMTLRVNGTERQDLTSALQKAWDISLALSNKFEAFDSEFDPHKFLDATTVSPQNWRYDKRYSETKD